MGEVLQTRTPDIQLFRDIFNASPIGIAVENIDGQLLFVNPAFCSFLGFTEEELRNKHCVDFSPAEDAEKDLALFQQLRAGSIDHYQLEKRYFRRDGSLVWGGLSISLLNNSPFPLVMAMVEDITDKKRAEETRFRHTAIVESSEDAIASVTLDGVVASWNAGAQRMFGYCESEIVGKPVTTLVPPERSDEETRILETLKGGARIDQLETIRVTKTGKRINVSLSISPIKDASGKIVGCSGIARDITERKRSEQALRESEERLRLAAQAGRMFAYSWDAASDVIERSGESTGILGVSQGEVATGAALAAMVHPEDREKLQATLAGLTVEHPNLRITYRMIRPDGAVIWLERNSRAYFDEGGKLKQVVGMVIDVTERKQAEEKLREFERAVEGVEELILVVDREYRCLMANRGFLKRRNLTSEQVVGRFVHEFVVREAYENVIKAKLDECFRGNVVRYELKYTYPEIGERDLFATYYPVKGNTGLDRAVCILHDITDRKRAERTLAEMTRKLIESQEQERARIGRELHDDINQRLAMFSVQLEQLQQNPAELQRRVQELRRELRQISDDVQAVSHDLHSSKLEYLGAVAGMKSWCREVAERHKSEVAFRSDFPGNLSLDIGLPLFRVLQEAVNNAIKHSGEKKVEVQLWEDSGEIHLSVRDSGKGFVVETGMPGKGLGLTSMRERVRLANGTIAIESMPMGGTNIHVRIPFARQSNTERL
jgi:PAS domain S-box-containing protein